MLANWMYFWDWDGAPIAPAPTVAEIDPTRGYGARGHDYHPLPEDYWQDRAKIIQVDKRNPADVFQTPPITGTPTPVNPAVAAQIADLTTLRSQLAANLLSAPTVADLTTSAADLKFLDQHIASLGTQKYT